MVLSVALICLALPVAWTLPARRRTVRTRALTPPAPSVAADLTAGFRAILCARTPARATATSVVSCTAQGVLVACTPLLGQQVLGGASRGTVLLSGIAISALAANAALSRRPGLLPPDSVILYSTLALAAALLLAATGRPVLLALGAVVAGAAEGPQLTALFAVRHREAPEPLRGQIFTTGASLKLTGFALGAALAGPVAGWSLPGALVVAAGLQLAAALTFVALGTARRDTQVSKNMNTSG